MGNKIALIGSAPSSVQLAPYKDLDWQIWGCSPGAIVHVPRADLWFEMHAMNDVNRPCRDPIYVERVNKLGCPVMMVEERPDIFPKAMRYPVEEMLEAFGPWCWGSTISHMFALAIYHRPEVIQLYGIDMSANEEYSLQRPTLHMLIDKAQDRGIEVQTPMESDLLRPTPMYGYREFDPLFIKMQKRREEITARINAAEQRLSHARDEIHFLKGALDDLDYVQRTWPHERLQIDYALYPAARKPVPAPAPEAPTKANGNGHDPYRDPYPSGGDNAHG